MKAIVRDGAGKKFSTMKIVNVESQEPKKDELKIRMVSSRINPVDMDLMKGFPSLNYAKGQIGGVDGSGEVIAKGKDVKGFEIGDKVFFYRLFSDIGSWAEEVIITSNYAAKIPANLTSLEAGSVALPLLTAFEGITSLKPEKGCSILVHGAGGGVGSQAVQIARKLGLKVIVTASAKDEEELKSLGADVFYDYRRKDLFEQLKKEAPIYVFDTVGKVTLKKSIELKPRSIISTCLPDVDKMGKTGVSLPAILRFLLRVMNRSYYKLAKRNGVILSGQVTGANGKLLSSASEFVSTIEGYKVKHFKSVTLSELEEKGMSEKNVGQTILFHDQR